MQKMKGERAQPMSLEHLDSEFLFCGTLKKLSMFIIRSFAWLICQKMDLFLKNVEIICIEKVSIFSCNAVLGQVV